MPPTRCEVLCYGPIGGWFGIEPGDVIRQLKANPAAEEVVIRIHSPGGDALDGIAIGNVLRAHAGKKTVMIDGLAGSAASVIAMAGDEVVMAESSMMMLHNPFTVAMGDGDALREQADVCDAVARAIVAAYQRKTGKSEEETRALMTRNNWDAGTWLTAKEAVAAGLADRVGPPISLQASAHLRPGTPAAVADLYAPRAADPPVGASPLQMSPGATMSADPRRIRNLRAALFGALALAGEGARGADETEARLCKRITGAIEALSGEVDAAHKLHEPQAGAPPAIGELLDLHGKVVALTGESTGLCGAVEALHRNARAAELISERAQVGAVVEAMVQAGQIGPDERAHYLAMPLADATAAARLLRKAPPPQAARESTGPIPDDPPPAKEQAAQQAAKTRAQKLLHYQPPGGAS